MPVKYWSFAGLILTYWCNARCASCYLKCGPQRGCQMTVQQALDCWSELIDASPHGCRIHLTGGEPFGDWPRLIELCTRGRRLGLGPLASVETNAFWATDEALVRRRLRQLDDAGMAKLVISTDPYHQQFVPIQRCRLAAKVAAETVGGDRVRVRWRDWLADGFDTAGLSEQRRRELFARYARSRRDRLTGRAAELVAGDLESMGIEELADSPCAQRLLRSRHVHVDAGGRVMPGTCAGIVLGRRGRSSVADIWRRLRADHAARPIVGVLAGCGPVGLLDEAGRRGFVPRAGYAGKCHLCWDVRRHLALAEGGSQELAPAWLYREDGAAGQGAVGGGGTGAGSASEKKS